MTNNSKQGIALILFGILVSLGAICNLGFCWVIGLAIGFVGLLLVLTDKGGKNL